jgi:peptidoglycan hydrolase CwlO-like protein
MNNLSVPVRDRSVANTVLLAFVRGYLELLNTNTGFDAFGANGRTAESKINAVDKRVDAVREDVKEIKSDVRSLQKDVSSLDKRVAKLEVLASSNQKDIEKLDTKIEKIDDRLWWMFGAIVVSILTPIALKFLLP